MPQKYLKLYEEHSDYESGSRPDVPNVSHCREEDHVHWQQDVKNKFLTFKILTAGNVVWKTSTNQHLNTIYYSKNNGDWIPITASTSNFPTIPVVAGDKLRFKGNNQTYGSKYGNCSFDSTANFEISGNIASLLASVNFGTITSFQSQYTFRDFFCDCNTLIDASKLILPATTLSKHCYSEMFCFCSSLIAAPELPATTLAQNCYYQMFLGCSSLTKAPILAATNLEIYSYERMFCNCYSLNYVECYASDISATGCTEGWLANVSQTGVFIRNSTTAWTTGTSGIPNGWTVQDAEV